MYFFTFKNFVSQKLDQLRYSSHIQPTMQRLLFIFQCLLFLFGMQDAGHAQAAFAAHGTGIIKDSAFVAFINEGPYPVFFTYSPVEGQKVFPAVSVTEIKYIIPNQNPYGIKPFYWGLAASVPGVILVYYKTRERQPTQKAIAGAVVNGLIIGTLFFVLTSI